MKRIEVVAGVIYNASADKILIALRPVDKHQGNLWEFPGGKKEAGETSLQALCRELEEELGIQATQCAPLMQLEHRYSDKHVALDIWQVTAFSGEPAGQEQQAIRWVDIADLRDYQFPAANIAIVEKLLSSSPQCH